ncbi:hypothetical protein EDD22DRAFT_69354 [Suillus occidentalis]|nr:hypothetical protein EDD22DRAFT_69354 [Suillus occidentalis]
MLSRAFYLSDSWSHYRDTCHTACTVHFGKPSPDLSEAYTHVLQGHARQRHPCCPTSNTSLNGNGTLRKNGIHVSRRIVSIHNSRSPSTAQNSQRTTWGPGLMLSLESLIRFPRPPIASTTNYSCFSQEPSSFYADE